VKLTNGRISNSFAADENIKQQQKKTIFGGVKSLFGGVVYHNIASIKTVTMHRKQTPANTIKQFVCKYLPQSCGYFWLLGMRNHRKVLAARVAGMRGLSN